MAFDRKAFFIHTKSDINDGFQTRLTPNVLLALRRAIITEELSVIEDVFSNLKLNIFPVYGPQQAVGLFLLSPKDSKDTTPEGRFKIAQDLHMFQQAIFTEYFARHQPSIKLTPREAEVLSWVAQGKSNAVIAKILRVSPHTIDNYLRRAYTKIGVNDRTSAAVKAMILGLTAL